MRVHCDTNPELSIYDLGVRFVKGVAVVDSEKAVEKLRSMEGFAFRFEEDAPSGEVKPLKPPKPPKADNQPVKDDPPKDGDAE